MRRILAIGRRPDGASMDDFLMNDVDEVVSRLGELCVVRCDTPNDLLEVVRCHGRGKGRVEQLDIFDHGAPGTQLLGDGVLFKSSESACEPLIGATLAESLRPHLSEFAQVRLLGCLTATAAGQAGRQLLLKLARVLGGHRIVFGTIDNVDVGDFGRDGFNTEQEFDLLYSSLAARDFHPPTPPERTSHLGAISTALCP